MSHEHCKQHPRPMPSPVMAAIRVRQSRRWVTWQKAYIHHFLGQARKIAVDNFEDELRQARLAQNRTFAAAILALLDHHRVVLERELSRSSAFIICS